ncbi:virginiamycin A acetyltransferase [Flavobacterium sp. 2755]|uniref:CatB-related O-acetyltransferase n=1 Tax=Flavobacterium sp. 2755 TaxID=2817765 RepID=UPI002856081B|nr:CatB-related O-acetyltransferase [Flavobacterium sp. 2755]MDR6762544.1 virginiamycin A acetyltransferase [Flavobacterium sp. 2755]
MILYIRKLLWCLLGINYYNYLKGKNNIYLKDAKWAVVGNKTYDNGAFVWKWYNDSSLKIGKYCSIANDVNFICDSGFHTESEVTSFPLFHQILEKNDEVIINKITYKVSDINEKITAKKAGIIIGNDVWIGMNATILPGVKIGNGVTIMSGAVVSNDIPDYAIAAGVPAKIIKYKHNPEIIDALNKISWWDWSDEKVKQTVNDFYLSIEEFIKKHS